MLSKSDIRKLQMTMTDMLSEIDLICRSNAINYYLVFGTLIGAVRHKGFIPWDPDIDIAMMRDDYEKFRTLFSDDISSDLFLEDFLTDKNHFSPHILIRKKGTHIEYINDNDIRYKPKYNGIYIDVFPLDEAPGSLLEQKKQNKKIKRITKIKHLKLASTYGLQMSIAKRFIKKVVQLLLSPVSFRVLNEKLDNVMKHYNGSNSGLTGCFGAVGFYWKTLFNVDVYGEPREVLFEGKKFLAPAKAEVFLESRYGDYMTLPPEDERFKYFNSIKAVSWE